MSKLSRLLFYKNWVVVSISIVFVAGSILFYWWIVSGFPSRNSQDWASFATFVGLSLSFLSVLFIYLTYHSQLTMSTVLQFDSTFFQWFSVHSALKNDLKNKIHSFVNNSLLPDMAKLTDFEESSFAEIMDKRKDQTRELICYYKSSFQLLRHIYRSPIITNQKERKKYYDILQSYMDDDELLLFLCFLMADVNRNKCNLQTINGETTSFIRLVDDTHILKNLHYPNNGNYAEFWEYILSRFSATKNSFYQVKLKEN